MTGTVSRLCFARGCRAANGALVLVGAALLLAGCGSSSSGSTSGRASAAAKDNGVASKSPIQIVAAAQSALRSVSGFVVAGTLIQGGEVVRLEVVEGGTMRLQVHISERRKSAEIIALPNAAYVRANQAYLSAQAGANTAGLANRWIELPAGAAQQFTSSLGPFAPNTLARCLGEDLGRLSRDGTTTVNGKPAVVVHEAGNVPGSSPGTLAVATKGPAYPLRVTSTGPTRGGGKIDACNTGKASDAKGSVTLSDFDHAPAITAPKHPVKPGASSNSSV
ncbi:MAG TPA: hypothetical protein VIJ33_01115 [Solirubrobacteraceae bacterium]